MNGVKIKLIKLHRMISMTVSLASLLVDQLLQQDLVLFLLITARRQMLSLVRSPGTTLGSRKQMRVPSVVLDSVVQGLRQAKRRRTVLISAATTVMDLATSTLELCLTLLRTMRMDHWDPMVRDRELQPAVLQHHPLPMLLQRMTPSLLRGHFQVHPRQSPRNPPLPPLCCQHWTPAVPLLMKQARNQVRLRVRIESVLLLVKKARSRGNLRLHPHLSPLNLPLPHQSFLVICLKSSQPRCQLIPTVLLLMKEARNQVRLQVTDQCLLPLHRIQHQVQLQAPLLSQHLVRLLILTLSLRVQHHCQPQIQLMVQLLSLPRILSLHQVHHHLVLRLHLRPIQLLDLPLTLLQGQH